MTLPGRNSLADADLGSGPLDARTGGDVYGRETRLSVIFLGGIFTSRQIDFILANSKGVVQNAADALQKSLIEGLATHLDRFDVVNLPYIGSYPILFRRAMFPSTSERVYDNVELHGQSFATVRFIHPFSRCVAALVGLWRMPAETPPVVLVYAAHMPFLWAALIYKAAHRGARVCLILPDLPEFMGDDATIYRYVRAASSRVLAWMVAHIDLFVVLTSAMAEKLGIEADRFVVVEGIARPSGQTLPLPEDATVFMYSGTLALRYGIRHLLDAFAQVRNPNARLRICGDGDGAGDVLRAVANDSRIEYLGQLPHSQAVREQQAATILVNPRLPIGDFTKYSFPSKTLEYMSSGRPVLMYRLPGVPEEYEPFFFVPDDLSVEALASCMERLAITDRAALAEKALRAQDFVAKAKSARTQTAKIVDLLVGRAA